MDRFGYPNDVVMDLFIIHGELDRITARICRVFNERYPELPVLEGFMGFNPASLNICFVEHSVCSRSKSVSRGVL